MYSLLSLQPNYIPFSLFYQLRFSIFPKIHFSKHNIKNPCICLIANTWILLFVEESGRIYMMNLAIRLTHPHYLVLRRLSYLLCQTLLISVYPLAGVKMKKCISVIYTDIHSIHGIRQKMLGYAREIAYFSKTVAKKRNTAQRFLCLLCRNCDVYVMDR